MSNPSAQMNVTRRTVRGAAWPPVAILASAMVVLVVVHLLWIERFRRGLPIDIDEAGYLGFALDDLRAFTRGGLGGLHDAVVAQRQFGPLVPLTAAPLLGMFGETPQVGMAVQSGFLAVLAFASYGLGARLAGRGAGVLSALVVLLAPGVFDFSRTFHFVVATTAMLALTVWALVESDQLERRGFVAAAGAAGGLLLLSRTYSVVFVPGIGIAALVLVCSRPRGRRVRAALNVGIAGVVAVVVAGWWYIPNVSTVWRYLTDYGYGARSKQYVHTTSSPLHVRFWTFRLTQLISDGLYLIPFLVLVGAIAAWVVMRVRSRRDRDTAPSDRTRMDRVLEMGAMPAGSITIVLVATYLVMTSSSNAGTGFMVPLVPLVVVLGAAAIMKLPSPGRAVLVAVLACALLVIAVGKTTVTGQVAQARCVTIPLLDCVSLTDGRGHIQRVVTAEGLHMRDPDAARRGPPGAWVRVARRAAEALHEAAGPSGLPPVVFFASRDPLFNTNTVGLDWRELYGELLPVGQLRPDDGGDSIRNYLRKLADPAYGQPTFLFAADRGPYEFPPKVTQPRAERAAGCLGFHLQRTFRLPDGRGARLYQRQVPLPPAVTGRAWRMLERSCAA